jgi:CheY-like chemotaxis protein
VGQGTGLGLAVAHGIVAAHGGHMAAHSQPGLGSSFHVYLPLADSPVVATADSPAPAGATPLSEPAAVPAGDALAAQPGRGETVLYVDDDEVMLHVVERLLQRLGYQPRCFADSRQALAAVRSGALAPALVVTDHNMPGLTGLELVAALRALAPGLPVVLSSGYLSDELQRDARALGVAALVHKQHTVETLGPLVARVMGQVVGAGGLGD